MVKILLLDCDKSVEANLVNKGFTVCSGTLGYGDGKRIIPEQLYEQNIIFVDIKKIDFLKYREFKSDGNIFYFPGVTIDNIGISIKGVYSFLANGGLLVTFVESSVLSREKEYAVYSWIPNFPYPIPTSDRVIKKNIDITNDQENIFNSIFRDFEVSIPVERNLNLIVGHNYRKLLLNQVGGILSVNYDYGNGQVLVLPKFVSNNDVILHIATNVYSKINEVKIHLPDYLTDLKSAKLVDLEKKIEDNKNQINSLEKEVESVNSEILEESNRIEKLIDNDETSLLIRRYLTNILEDKKVSWYFAYKIVERLENHFGGNSQAKAELGNAKVFNFIHRVANEGNRDTRHTPEVGVSVIPLTDEEISNFTSYSIDLVNAYLKFLLK